MIILIIVSIKVPILVHEVICVSIWREKVLPELLYINSNPKQSFTLYFIVSLSICYKNN